MSFNDILRKFFGRHLSASHEPKKKRSLGLCFEVLESRALLSGTAPLPTTDNNWAGYAAQTDLNAPQSGAVSAVGGSWVVPTVTGTSRGYSSAWVGIDGYSSKTVEQLGTEQDVSSTGETSYFAWYEMYPDDSVTIPNFNVAPGDAIAAEVSYTSGSFTLTITDTPVSGAAVETFSTTQTIAGALESSAEWIIEAPSISKPLPLANFGLINFTSAWATISGKTGPIDDPAWQTAQINMLAPSGSRSQTYTTEDSTSELIDSAPSAAQPLPPPAGTTSVSSFSVVYKPSTRAPLSAPTPSGPSGTIATIIPTFSWNAVTGAASYEIWLTDQTTGATSTVPNLAGTSWAPTKGLNLGDKYVWWVGAVQGNTIAWDSAQTFTIQPTALSPSGTSASTLPTFTWNSLTGANNYELWLTDQTTGVTLTPAVSGGSWTPTTPLVPGDNYIWWIGASKGAGAFAWSSPQTFTIAPLASAPGGTSASTLPTFTWTGVSGINTYEIWLTDQTTGMTLTPSVTGGSWTPTTPLIPGDNYIWWIGASKGAGAFAWSTSQNFTIASTAGGPNGTIATTLPTFTWNSVTGVSTYEIWLTDQTTGLTVTPAVTNGSWTPSTPLVPGDNYIWWLGAGKGAGAFSWSNARTFTIAPTATGPSGTVATTLPTFTWNNVTGVSTYEIWLTDQTTGLTVTPTVANGSWTPPTPLIPGDNYIWWIGAGKGAGTFSWSKAQTFTIAPTGTGPSGTVATTLPTFTWNSVTGVNTYEIWLTDQTTGVSTTFPNLSGTSWTPTQGLTLGDSYIWWVGAVQGKSIGWDTAQTFTIRSTASGPSGTSTSTRPTFAWTGVAGAASYVIWLEDQTTGTVTTYANLTVTSWTPSQPLQAGDTYVWWVGAVNGQTIAWDNPLSFNVSVGP